MKPEIKWYEVWLELDEWFQKKAKEASCPKCGSNYGDAPEWEDQMAMIQKIVNKQLRRGRVRRV